MHPLPLQVLLPKLIPNLSTWLHIHSNLAQIIILSSWSTTTACSLGSLFLLFTPRRPLPSINHAKSYTAFKTYPMKLKYKFLTTWSVCLTSSSTTFTLTRFIPVTLAFFCSLRAHSHLTGFLLAIPWILFPETIKWLVMLVRVYISHPQRDFPDHPVKCHSLITSRHFNGTKFYQILCYLYIFLLSDSSKSM